MRKLKKDTQALADGDIPTINGGFRDSVLSSLSKVLMSQTKILWYMETLVLSARFLQKLKNLESYKHSKLRRNRIHLWRKDLLPGIKQGSIVLEFGVATAAATKWWANQDLQLSEWHGFDTFTGLPSDWQRGGVSVMKSGYFNQNGVTKNPRDFDTSYPIIWHKGLISETLKKLEINLGGFSQRVIFIDVDLYEPTLDVLEFMKGKLKPGDLIYFDEAFDPWNEGKALDQMMSALPPHMAISHTGSALLLEFLEENAI